VPGRGPNQRKILAGRQHHVARFIGPNRAGEGGRRKSDGSNRRGGTAGDGRGDRHPMRGPRPEEFGPGTFAPGRRDWFRRIRPPRRRDLQPAVVVGQGNEAAAPIRPAIAPVGLAICARFFVLGGGGGVCLHKEWARLIDGGQTSTAGIPNR